MQKINFQNLPSTATPVNATNLNTLQTNVENGTVQQEYLGSNPDINSLKTKSGIYGLYNCSQAPDLGLGVLEVMVYTTDWVVQIFTAFDQHIWKTWGRTYYNGTTWNDWKRLDGPEIELYNDNTGSNSSITLSESLAYFRYIEIYYEAEDVWNYIKVYEPDTKTVMLNVDVLFDTSNYMKNTKWTCSGTTIVCITGNAYAVAGNSVSDFSPNNKAVKIHKVVGYR